MGSLAPRTPTLAVDTRCAMDCVLLRDICTPCATSCMADVRMAMVA